MENMLAIAKEEVARLESDIATAKAELRKMKRVVRMLEGKAEESTPDADTDPDPYLVSRKEIFNRRGIAAND